MLRVFFNDRVVIKVMFFICLDSHIQYGSFVITLCSESVLINNLQKHGRQRAIR